MKPQTQLLIECARRTPIVKANPAGDFLAAVGLAALFILANFL